VDVRYSSNQAPIVAAARVRYLAEIAQTVRGYKQQAQTQGELARQAQQLRAAADAHSRASRSAPAPPKPRWSWPRNARAHAAAGRPRPAATVAGHCAKPTSKMNWWSPCASASCVPQLTHTTLSRQHVVRKIALPRYHDDHGDLLTWLMLENLPGHFPYTAGTFAFKREGEDPTRMFAGEGDPFRTNRRFQLLSEGMPAKRLIDGL
jgi:methylmalonyl-CoA mutase